MPWEHGRLPESDPATEPILGPGQSRPLDGQRTYEYAVLVKLAGAAPVRWITRAPSARDAIKYAKNRWRNCTATIVK